MEFVDADDAIARIRSGDRVFLHGGASTPYHLVDALVRRAGELERVEIVHLHTDGPAPYALPGMERAFRHNALFIGPNTRQAVADGRADYTPVFLSEIPGLFEPGGALPLDVALVQVTPPDASGECTLGVSVDVAVAAIRNARLVIAQVNPLLPRPLGIRVPATDIHLAVEAAEPLAEHLAPGPTAESVAIARHVATLVDDGATLQMGIGGIPDAVLAELKGHRDLGVHTEMFSDGLVPLIEAGVVNGARKNIMPGVAVSAFAIGTRRLYRFVDQNPAVAFYPVSYTNDVDVIASNHRMVAINSALSVDLTGQVTADAIGPKFYSGIGGQLDFIRGSARSPGGVPIIALPSTAAGGAISRIVAALPEAAGVVTTRGDVHWVITEYGMANLHGRTIRDRARLLIDLAHPAYRASLEAEAARLGYLR